MVGQNLLPRHAAPGATAMGANRRGGEISRVRDSIQAAVARAPVHTDYIARAGAQADMAA